MDFIIAIPARYQSSRLPGKPLLEIGGKPMIQHVYEQASSSGATAVIVATDDDRIKDSCESFGARVCMTRTDHTSGTERLAEVAEQLGWSDDQIVVNLQGDEPMMPATLVRQVAADLEQFKQASIATLMTPITGSEEHFDPNVVKVVTDSDGYALYFSRAPIPWARDQYCLEPGKVAESAYRHLGLYAYRSQFLRIYPTLNPSVFEKVESLEQLRALHHGYRIHLSIASELPGRGVDVEEDLEAVRAMMSAAVY